MSSAPAKSVEIRPNNNYLSAAELIAQRHAEAEVPRIGLKRTTIEGSAAEQQELESAYANLRRQLSARRIERHAGRAVAVWHQDQQAAEVLRKDGKFESFGYSEQGKLYLEYYEALFLLELNRLQLEYCETIVSVEQAYTLLLGEAASEKYNNYLVYSALSRAGYIVVKHQAAAFDNSAQTYLTSTATIENCIWALLEQTLSKKPVPSHITASTLYATAQARMTEFKQQIMSQSTANRNESSLEHDFKFETRKRRAQSEPQEEIPSKRAYATATSNSLVDILTDETCYLRFKQTFKKLDIVQLRDNYYDKHAALRSFKICFDLHLHNEGFKRSAPKLPSFSVILLPTNEPFPTHDEMVKCRREQLPHTAPLLVISVSESKQIQAFLYYIS